MKTDNNLSPTPYRDVNLVLQKLLNSVQGVLGEYFIGMYLHGSLAGGEFDSGRSDIDFLVVTGKELPGKLLTELEAMHKHLYQSGLVWMARLEGAYASMDAVRTYSPTGPAWAYFNEGKFEVACQGIDWVINRYVLYTSGVVITGPPLQDIVDPVHPEQLREAALTMLRDNWTPWLYNSDLFLGTGYQSFVVLTMCRALYTLRHGTVATKRHSAEWAIANLDMKWASLIRQALSWHYGDPSGDIGQTQEFMYFIMREAGVQGK